jgi:hypothetical protein
VSGRGWRRVAIGLGLLVALLGWRSCMIGGKRKAERDRARAADIEADGAARGAGPSRGRGSRAAGAGGGGDMVPGGEDPGWSPADDVEPPPPEPHWLVKFFSPKPGEDMLAYRDRVLPVVEAVVEPQRVRVAENWREFADSAGLDGRQKAELGAAVDQAVESLMDQALQGVLSGEISLGTKPSVGVAFARDLLDTVDQANRRFRAVLRPHQLELLDRSRFDVADYLLFATRWEELLGVTR